VATTSTTTSNTGTDTDTDTDTTSTDGTTTGTTTSAENQVPTAIDAGDGGQADPGDITLFAGVLGAVGAVLFVAGWFLTRRRTGTHL